MSIVHKIRSPEQTVDKVDQRVEQTGEAAKEAVIRTPRHSKNRHEWSRSMRRTTRWYPKPMICGKKLPRSKPNKLLLDEG